MAVSYSYNALGQRVQKTSATGTTLFAYDAQGHLLGEYQADGKPVQETVWLGDMPVAVLSTTDASANISYIWADHLGTPRQITDPASKQILWRWDGEPFGNSLADEDPSKTGKTFSYNLRFPGQYFDKETGKHYNNFRVYDPATGRYIQSDPIGLAGGINTYGYADALPTTKTDQLGLATYICKRPFGGKPGSYAPPLFNHTYVCVGSGANMKCGSTTASSGGAFSNIFGGSLGKPTTPVTDYYKSEACEKRQADNSCIETCISNKLNIPTRPKYGVGPSGDDCQEYTEDIVSTCEKICKGRS
ncbi:hypothetical protein HA050_21630 [Iodobacter sp. HSC-16F04]|uniref:RHS repeat-associated core domain-containing protein n=1 Tax=Iodobacter violaceini TaxID=3044271 RepID=A0ABX0KVG2_9NEIS|nr:hypothetical protein [Iodobacter violacea]